MTKQIAAFFDIDGTIFRNTLMLEHLKFLVNHNYVISKDHLLKLEELELSWESRKIDYDTYMKHAVETYNNALKLLPINVIEKSSQEVVDATKHQLYRVTHDRIREHKKLGHRVIFISGSPSFLVEKFAKELQADDWSATEYRLKGKNFYSEKVEKPMWDSVSKNKQLTKFVKQLNVDLKQSYAYGDTQGDYLMLSRVGHPIAINPNMKLLKKLAKSPFKQKVKVFVERKNVVYSLNIDSINIEN